ncbi:MAG: SIR2 family protein [Acidobacteria bacterium]|nr:SIR2 family protein [Acidobacteriota bacterium]
MRIELEHSFRKALQNGFSLFTGSGFSLLAADKYHKPLPLGNELKKELIDQFRLVGMNTLSLAQVCTVLESTRRQELYAHLTTRFTVDSFSPYYHALKRVNIRNIFTTNIDNLLMKVYSLESDRYLNDIDLYGSSSNDEAAIDYIALHGCVTHAKQSFTFSASDIASAYSSDPDKWHFLTGRLQKLPTLFWGYSLEDAGVLQALNPASASGRRQEDKWIVVRSEDPATISYFTALGFNVIIGDTQQLLEYFGKVANRDAERDTQTARTKDPIFDGYQIPSVGSVAVRPISEFYQGAVPSWNDIFSGSIHRTSHYRALMNAINSGKTTILVGMTASGKSTLLMDAAASHRSESLKLFLPSPCTPDRARLMIERLGGRKCLVFIDDFTADVDCYREFVSAPGITVVAADRDYNVEIISHRIDRSTTNILSVTDLAESDIQSVFFSVPSNLRSSHLNRPETERYLSPSLFEIVTANIVQPNIVSRIRSMLKSLLQSDPWLHDLFVACCYVHNCRVPASYDLISAFLRERCGSYEEIYEMINNLGSVMTEYSGWLTDSDQDHFTPRSNIVSDAVMQEVAPVDLKRVLTRFHDEVSSYRISRMDIFRRRAFDAHLFERAFARWEDGRDMYLRLFDRDRTPYILQQGALYLSAKSRFTEAFSWIDRALEESGGTIPSIRHSHAIILFKANFGKEDVDGGVEAMLCRSMEILSEVYYYDRRKTYHALTYADQSLKFHRSYPGAISKGYLETAKRWLNVEVRASPWDRQVRRVCTQVEDAIKQI